MSRIGSRRDSRSIRIPSVELQSPQRGTITERRGKGMAEQKSGETPEMGLFVFKVRLPRFSRQMPESAVIVPKGERGQVGASTGTGTGLPRVQPSEPRPPTQTNDGVPVLLLVLSWSADAAR